MEFERLKFEQFVRGVERNRNNRRALVCIMIVRSFETGGARDLVNRLFPTAGRLTYFNEMAVAARGRLQ